MNDPRFINNKIDERDTMFSRMALEKDSKEYNYYYAKNPDIKDGDDRIRQKPDLCSEGTATYDPVLSKIADSNFEFLADIKHLAEGKPALKVTPVDTEKITKLLKNLALHYGAVVVGVVKLKDYHVYSNRGRNKESYGDEVHINHSHAIVFGVEMAKEIMNRAPKVSAVMETSKAYVDGAIVGMQLSYFLHSLGYEARNHMDGNYLVHAISMARDAGIGEVGRNGLLTTIRYGSRIRLGIVTTNLELLETKKKPFALKDLCISCKKCVRTCIGKAISKSDDIETWRCEQEKCYDKWRSLGTDCGICVSVCPLSQDSPYDIFGSGFESFNSETISQYIELYNTKYGIRPFDKRAWPLEDI